MNSLTIDREKDKNRTSETQDAVLAMLGVGRHLWELEPGERFVERLRSEDSAASPYASGRASLAENLPEAVWGRIEKFQGEQFHTARGLPFTFKVDGNGIWIFREGQRINRKLTRAQAEVAISRCPLNSTTEINDLLGSSYFFAVLMDRRIRGDAW